MLINKVQSPPSINRNAERHGMHSHAGAMGTRNTDILVEVMSDMTYTIYHESKR